MLLLLLILITPWCACTLHCSFHPLVNARIEEGRGKLERGEWATARAREVKLSARARLRSGAVSDVQVQRIRAQMLSLKYSSMRSCLQRDKMVVSRVQTERGLMIQQHRCGQSSITRR